MVYGRKNCDRNLLSRLIDRSVLIYRYHIITFLFFLFIVSAFPFYMDFWSSIAPEFSSSPLKALLKGLVLLYQPHPLDILPMYVLFVLMLFPMLNWLQKGKTSRYFILTVGVYLTVQIFRTLSGLNFLIGQIDFDSFAAFNVFAWQMLFFLSVWLGYNQMKVSKYLQQNRWIGLIALSIATVLFTGKHVLNIINYYAETAIELPYILISKRNAGIISLINALAFGLTIYYVFNKLSFLKWRFFSALGSISMKAFAIHLVTYMLFYPFAVELGSISLALEVVFTLIMVGLMYVPYLLKDESILSSIKYLIYKLQYSDNH
ncbi:MAG: OpgC domain-containing protein [Cyclobacteriaceae bacterium]|nr:OpgC domain-containing protein [Cyclobacteriaceae bacterium]